MLTRFGPHAIALAFAGPRWASRFLCRLASHALALTFAVSHRPYALTLALLVRFGPLALATASLCAPCSPWLARPRAHARPVTFIGFHALALASAGSLWPHVLALQFPSLARFGLTLAFACSLRIWSLALALTFAGSPRASHCRARLCWLASRLTLSRSLLLARCGLHACSPSGLTFLCPYQPLNPSPALLR